ncbi:hypothetical protein XENOCAPTIV_020355, partial [Xenoophorus captivus]
PFNTVERKSSYGVIDCDQTRKEVVVRTGGMNDKSSRKTYTFDMVFGPAAKQIEVYRSVVCPILDEVIMGYNCTDPLAGIIPRTLHQIFEKLSENGTEFSVKVSLLEIYNEELFDLLSPTEDVNERLQLFDDPRNKVAVGQEEMHPGKSLVPFIISSLCVCVAARCGGEGAGGRGGPQQRRSLSDPGARSSKEEDGLHAYERLLQVSIETRHAAASAPGFNVGLNVSVLFLCSRSHSVFSVTIHMKEITLDGEELVKIGKLNLVDLAGSENIGRSGAVDKRAREAGNINQSLLTLGRVITALVEKRPHVPYRESKLTRILQDSLGGRTKTSIIATVSPSSSNLEEYTEEIERLKRDLAATRDKNGVYLSSENYESMVTQIAAHEEQIAEYVDKIAIMEEELKKVSPRCSVTDLFVDSKNRLEQCALDLDQKQQRLEETNKHLENTKEKLVQEEFICSELSLVHESLYSTAGQLLSTVDESTSDVSGLHDKLDRKKKVRRVHLISCVSVHENHEASLVNDLNGLLVKNDAALRGALSTVETFVGGVQSLVADGVARCQEKLQQQEALSQEHKEGLLQLLEEHQQEMEDVLAARTLLGLSAVKELSATLKSTVETQRSLADQVRSTPAHVNSHPHEKVEVHHLVPCQVEAMKEMGAFFSGLVQELVGLRQSTMHGLSALQAEQEKLGEEIRQAQERHQKDQLNLLTMETQQDYSDLRSANKALQTPAQTLQENISRLVENQTSSQADLLSSTASSTASSLRQTAEESQKLLEETNGYYSDLHSSVSGLVERDVKWTLRTREHADRRAQEQLTLVEQISEETRSLRQSVQTWCTEQLRTAKEELTSRQEETKQSLSALQNQTCSDRQVLGRQQAELEEYMETGQQLVHSFLQEELKADVPTGLTPQRREFVYPRHLNKSRSRNELLEALRRQQEELQGALEEEEEEETPEEDDKQSQVDHVCTSGGLMICSSLIWEAELPRLFFLLNPACFQDSLEDISTCNESLATEPSFIDENLVFNESKRVPFFKVSSENWTNQALVFICSRTCHNFLVSSPFPAEKRW